MSDKSDYHPFWSPTPTEQKADHWNGGSREIQKKWLGGEEVVHRDGSGSPTKVTEKRPWDLTW